MNGTSRHGRIHQGMLIAASLAFALGITAAHGANGAIAPEAKSDGMGAALSDTVPLVEGRPSKCAAAGEVDREQEVALGPVAGE